MPDLPPVEPPPERKLSVDTQRLIDLTDKVDDVLDKCNDILEKLNE